MKKNRQEKILEIIEKQDVETQEDLARLLQEAGFRVTQATVSRDIRELKLSKVAAAAADASGGQKYAVLGHGEEQMGDRYIRVLKEGFTSMDIAQNLVVIKTVSGMAMAVAAALDAMKFPEVLGCIAGDDTIMVASRTMEEAGKLIVRIDEIIQGPKTK